MSEADKKWYRELAIDYGNGAKLQGYFAAVHLEANDDIVFWDKVFRHFLPQYSFNYIPYTKTPKGTDATGCTACLKYFESECLSKDFFICIDSDYRWLLQEKGIDIEHFVFQTYTYSWENHYCYFENIENIFKKSGFSNSILDIKTFLEEFSKLMYRPFMYRICSVINNDRYDLKLSFDINIQSLKTTQGADKFFIETIDGQSDDLKKFKKKYKEDIASLQSRGKKLGINSLNTYLYFRGHDIFAFILKMTKEIYKQLEKEATKGYTNEEKTEYYSNKRKTIKEWLTEDICFDKYFAINRIKADAEIYKRL